MSLDKLLDSCLNDIENHRVSVEECAARHPELAPLLELAVQLRSAPAPDPSPEFLRATRARLLTLPVPAGNGAADHAAPAPRAGWVRRIALPRFDLWPRLTWRWQPAFAAVMIALIAVVALSIGAARVSAGALPSSPLYPVKRGIEQAQLLLAGSQEQRALLHAEFAQRRLSEAVQVAALGREDQAALLSDDYRAELHSAVVVAEQAIVSGAADPRLPGRL